MAVVALFDHGTQLFYDGLSWQYNCESVIVLFLAFAVSWFALTGCKDGCA